MKIDGNEIVERCVFQLARYLRSYVTASEYAARPRCTRKGARKGGGVEER